MCLFLFGAVVAFDVVAVFVECDGCVGLLSHVTLLLMPREHFFLVQAVLLTFFRLHL